MKQLTKAGKVSVLTLLISLATLSLFSQERVELSVRQSVEYAMKNSVQVKNALADVKIQEQVNREITAAAYPQLSGNVALNYFPKVPIQTFPNFIAAATYKVLETEAVRDGNGNTIIAPDDFGLVEAQFGTRFTGSAGLDLSQILFDGQVFVGLQARSAAMDYARKGAEVTQEQIKANIYKVYFQLVIGRTQLGTVDANISRLEKLLSDTREIFKNGFAEKLDIDKVEVSLTNLKTDKLRIENRLQAGYLGLKVLIGMPVNQQLVLTDSLTESMLKENLLEGEYIYSDRKEYQQIELAKKLGEYNIKRYKLTYFPTVAAFGSYSYNAQRNKFDFFNFNQQWFPTALVGLKVSVPIFDGFAKDARVRKAELELEQTTNNIEGLKLSIDQQVEASRISMRSAVATMDFQKRNMVLAESIYDQAKRKYEQGLGSNLEITNAETELRAAQINYYSSLYDAVIARVDYMQAVGKL